MNDELEFYKAQVKVLNQEVSRLTSEILNVRVALEMTQNQYVEMVEKYSVAMAQNREPAPDNFGQITPA